MLVWHPGRVDAAGVSRLFTADAARLGVILADALGCASSPAAWLAGWLAATLRTDRTGGTTDRLAAVCCPCLPGVRSADAGALGSASLLVQAEPAPPAAPAAAGRQQQQPRLLASTTSCPPGAPAGAAAVAAGGPDGNASGSCIVSQPVNTSALLSSSTQQMLSGCHSAPHGLLQVIFLSVLVVASITVSRVCCSCCRPSAMPRPFPVCPCLLQLPCSSAVTACAEEPGPACGSLHA